MSQNQGRVTPIKQHSGDQAAGETPPRTGRDTTPESTSGGPDLSKIAILVSLLSLVLTVIFFFGLNRNLSGLSSEVRDIGAIRNNVAALDGYVDDLLAHSWRVNAQIAQLQDDRRTDAVLVLQESMIDDMLRKAAFMNEQLAAIESDDADRVAKLDQVRRLLQELREAPSEASAVPAAPEPQASAEPDGEAGQAAADPQEEGTAPPESGDPEPVLQ